MRFEQSQDAYASNHTIYNILLAITVSQARVLGTINSTKLKQPT